MGDDSVGSPGVFPPVRGTVRVEQPFAVVELTTCYRGKTNGYVQAVVRVSIPLPRTARGAGDASRRIPRVAGLVDREGQGEDLRGLWRSPAGSLYTSDGESFVCVAVHTAACRGWLNRVAVTDIRRVDGGWVALQAFRDNLTGVLAAWEPIVLEIQRDVITKYFPAHLPRHTLAHGYVERYDRVRPS